MTERMGDLVTEDGQQLRQDSEKLQALVAHNFITDPLRHTLTCIVTSPAVYKEFTEEELRNTANALQDTKISCVTDPDGISYRLIKMLQKHNIGKALLMDITRCTPSTTSVPVIRVPAVWTEMNLVMIPKADQAHTNVKG